MLAKFMGWALLSAIRLLTGAQARWWGCPPKAEQRIYFANHQSHLDLVMIWAALPEELRSITRPIAARDYWATTPFKRWITTEVFNAIYVERGGSAAAAPSPVEQAAAPPVAPGSAEALAPLQPLIEALRSGDSIIIFPEGTRGNTGVPQNSSRASSRWRRCSPKSCWCPRGSTTCSA